MKFIRANKGTPFFLYMPYTMAHVPLFASKDFAGKSPRGPYGDAIEELDWSVGEILKTLRELKIDKNTFVFLTSDNGPWLQFGEHGGSAGPLRDGKGSTWEGGMREPGIAWWPGTVPAGVTTQEMACTLDLYVTAIKLAGGEVPSDRPIDGYDLAPLLTGKGKSPRDTMFYYRGTKLYAVRHGPWKAHFVTQPAYGGEGPTEHDPPVLYHLGRDPGEKTDAAKDNPDVVAKLKEVAEKHRKGMKPGENQLEKRIPPKK